MDGLGYWCATEHDTTHPEGLAMIRLTAQMMSSAEALAVCSSEGCPGSQGDGR